MRGIRDAPRHHRSKGGEKKSRVSNLRRTIGTNTLLASPRIIRTVLRRPQRRSGTRRATRSPPSHEEAKNYDSYSPSEVDVRATPAASSCPWSWGDGKGVPRRFPGRKSSYWVCWTGVQQGSESRKRSCKAGLWTMREKGEQREKQFNSIQGLVST